MSKISIFLAISALLGSPAAASADSFASPWVAGAGAKARLVVAGGPVDGAWQAAVEIRLDPGEVTYWRSPGETGVPPDFDFKASSNVATATVAYPAPHDLTEAGNIEAFGYETKVLFPVRVTAATAGQPASLRLVLNYAACAQICAPLHADLALALPMLPVTSPYARDIAAWRAQVPRSRPVAPAALAAATTRAPGVGKPAWLFQPQKIGIAATHLFVEPPDGYYVTAKPEGDDGAFRLTLSGAPTHPKTTLVPVRFTATGKSGPVEWRGTLDASPSKP